jgi:cold shock CspA family protein/ribosome-associated translation inhibitor RaiA
MQTALELNYHDVPRSPWSEALIRERVDRLERYRDDIISCTVIVSQPHKHQHKGNPYRVGIEVHLPRNRRLMVTEEPALVEQDSDLAAVITAAFSTMERRLESAGESRRRDALTPGAQEPRGLVVRLFAEEGYGFLRSLDGEEYYFHRNSVLHEDFERLAVGTEVRFAPEAGEAGPQASTVQIVNKPGARESADTRERDDVPPGWRNTPG